MKGTVYMNILVKNNCIEELECGSNFSYILNDNDTFLSTDYKVLQSQTNSCFVKCMKMLYNGNIQLYYLTKEFRSFASMLSQLDIESFMTIVSNLLSDIIDINLNGFLSCQNIDISFDHVYVDPATLKVSLIYLPLTTHLHEDGAAFENELRTELVKVILGFPALSSTKTMQLSVDLSDGTLSIEDILFRIKGTDTTVPAVNDEKVPVMRLIALNAPAEAEIKVTKDEFTLGKKADLCDGVINFNRLISRLHCKIAKSGDVFTVTDLQSVNGTYVNKVKLHPYAPEIINHGDVLRLANSDFRVVIE